jgi:hypothetical protein
MPDKDPSIQPETFQAPQTTEADVNFEPWALDPSVPREVGAAAARRYVEILRDMGTEPSDAVLEAADLPPTGIAAQQRAEERASRSWLEKVVGVLDVFSY